MRKICHFKKVSYLRQFKGWRSHFFQNPKELEDLIDKGNLIHQFFPKQTDIDKILQNIQRNVLKGTHLPVEVKEIQAGYLHNPYFKDIYQFMQVSHSVLVIVEIDFLWNRTVDSLKTSFHPLLWTLSGLKG